MRVVHHGGMCCGIKTIYNLGYHPHEMHLAANMGASSAKDVEINDADQCGHHVGSDKDFAKYHAPHESAEERLARLIKIVEKHRKKHLIEVTTSTFFDQTEKWSPVLEGLGFKAVTVFKNSNSGQKVTVWHRVHDKK